MCPVEKSLLAALGGALALGVPPQAPAVIHAFGAISVNVAEETPPPVGGASGSGVFNAVYDDVSNQLTFHVSWTGLTTNATAGHLHGPAGPGVPAGVQVDLSISGGTSGSHTATVSLSPAQETMLLGGLMYINIHTVTNGGGEIRGQIIEDAATHSFADISLNTAEEVPAPVGAPTSTGSLDVAYNSTTQQLTYGVSWSGMSSAVNAMHFHSPAAPGFSSPPAVGITGHPTGTTGTMAGSATLTPSQGTDLLNGLMYFNIHTVNNAPGEIRGQLVGGVTVPAELSVFQAN